MLLVHPQCRTLASHTAIHISVVGTLWASRSSSCTESLRITARNSPPGRCRLSGIQQVRTPSHISGIRLSHTYPSGSGPSTPAARSAPCTGRMPSPGTASRTSGEHKRGGTRPGKQGRRTAIGTLDGTSPSFELPAHFPRKQEQEEEEFSSLSVLCVIF
jgi:hypothetical protein